MAITQKIMTTYFIYNDDFHRHPITSYTYTKITIAAQVPLQLPSLPHHLG
jgi:hypothetical protein